MQTDADLIRRRVAILRRHHSPGVNPYLTERAWHDMVMALAFGIIEERIRTAADDAAQVRACSPHIHAEPRVVDVSGIIAAARAELDRPWTMAS